MDASLLRICVVSLASVCGLSVIGCTIIACFGREIPPILASIGSTAAGALVGILVLPNGAAFQRNSDGQK